jgi:hypothetical protein
MVSQNCHMKKKWKKEKSRLKLPVAENFCKGLKAVKRDFSRCLP